MTEGTIQEAERNLPELFASFKLPTAVAEKYRQGLQPFGPKSYAKLVFFAARVHLSNEDYHKYCKMPAARQEDETYEQYKKRQKLAKFLERKKQYYFDYDEYDLGAKKRRLAERKAKNELKKLI